MIFDQEQGGNGQELSRWEYDFIFSDTFAEFIDLIPEAIIISDEAGKIVLSNQLASQLFSYSAVEFRDLVIEDLVPMTISNIHSQLRSDFFNDPKPRHLKGRDLSLHAVKKNSTEFPMESALFAILTTKGKFAVNMIQDISDRHAEQLQITEYAFVDALTTLPNRRYFDTTLERTLEKSNRHQQPLALIYLDLDKFKPINDNCSHEAGDNVLRTISQRLTQAIRKEDFLARIGGDEFAIIVFPLDKENGLEKVLQRILSHCAEAITVDNKQHLVSASIGIAITRNKSIDPTTLIRQADKAMYASKARGGNCYSYYKDD